MQPVGENQEPVPLPAGIRNCHTDMITLSSGPESPGAVNTFYYSITKDMKPVVLFRQLISKHHTESVSDFIKIVWQIISMILPHSLEQ